MATIDKATLVASRLRKPVKVDIPGLGEAYVRGMSAGAAAQVESLPENEKLAFIVADGLCTEEGEGYDFTEAERAALSEQLAGALIPLVRKIDELSCGIGGGDKAVEEAVKN